MNLTLIKNFFTSDRIEPVKIGRVLRRSFRIKRNSNAIHEKRKSGKYTELRLNSVRKKNEDNKKMF